MIFSRYAIYFLPSPGPLTDFCAGWLGWDAQSGTTPPAPNVKGLPLPQEEITRQPRKYGFHGTIKPPFRLASGETEEKLCAALDSFCTTRGAVRPGQLGLVKLGRFLALVPSGDTTALNELAAATVRQLDGFRAPMSDAELARRREAKLSARQDAHLVQWGYPYVFEDFRFHLTLTGKMPKAEVSAVHAVLVQHLTPVLPDPFEIDNLCLMGEDPDGRFRLIRRFALTGAT